ncbi:breast cancer type 1 susceptibility protein homolog isoform X2 [Montipora foliosa]
MPVKVQDVLEALQQMQKSLECSICLELLKDPHSTKCNHQFCGKCIKQVLEKSSKKSKNKWYCPLCKTPVSKRSLTPNPKLSEIVEAVRNLQVAVQDDSGVPTGSPPLVPLKTCSIDSSPVSDPSHNLLASTSRKDNADQAIEVQPPQLLSETSIRSSVAHTNGNASKSKKPEGTNTKSIRRTRHSKRISKKNAEVEDINEKNLNVDLLHLIDTMSFQPASNTGVIHSPRDFILVPNTHESKPEEKSMTTYDLCKSTQNNDQGSNCNRIISSDEQKEREKCLPTIAEADSSVLCETSPLSEIQQKVADVQSGIIIRDTHANEAAVSSTKVDSTPQSSMDTTQSLSILPPLGCLGGIVTDICNKNKDVAVEETEDVTVVISDGGKQIQQSYAAVGDVCSESQNTGHLINQKHNICEVIKDNKQVITEIPSQDDREESCNRLQFHTCREDSQERITDVSNGTSVLTSTELTPVCAQEREVLTCKRVCDDVWYEREARDNDLEDVEYETDERRDHSDPVQALDSESQEGHKSQLLHRSEEVGPREPNKVDTSSATSLAEQSLDFEGLVSLLQFDDPSVSKPLCATEKDEVWTTNLCVDILGKDGNSSPTKVCCQTDLQETEIRGSLGTCEHVKLGKRRRNFEMEADSDLSKDEMRSNKRSADSANREVNTYDEPSSQGGAKKKLKLSSSASLSVTSISVDDMLKESLQENHKDFSISQKAGVNTNLKGDELDADINSNSSRNTELSNEVIPHSVSSSETLASPIINPMLIYINHTWDNDEGSNTNYKEGCSLKASKEGGQKDVIETTTSMNESRLNNMTDTRVETTRNVQMQSLEQPLRKQETSSHLSASQNCSPNQQRFVSMRVSQVNISQHLIADREEQKQKIDDQVEESKNQSFDASESVLVTIEENFQINEDAKLIIDSSQGQRKVSNLSQKWKHLMHSPEEYILSKDEIEINDRCVKTAEAAVKTSTCSKSSSQGDRSVDFTPTQSSLDSLEIDGPTPCLFQNDSWETAGKRKKLKRDQNESCCRFNSIPNHNDKHNISMSTQVCNVPVVEYMGDESTCIDDATFKTDSKGMRVGENSQLKSIHSPFHGLKATDNPDSEGTHSSGTIQSVSVLQEVEECTKICNLNFVHHTSCGQDEGNVEEEEPLPKKARGGWLDMNGLLPDVQRGRKMEKTGSSQLADSEVIPPTPVRPLAPSVVKASCSKLMRKGKGDAATKPQHEHSDNSISKNCQGQCSPEDGSLNSIHCSVLIQKTSDVEDSFDWSGNQNNLKDHPLCTSLTRQDKEVCLTEDCDSFGVHKAEQGSESLNHDFAKKADLGRKKNEADCVVVDSDDEHCQSADEREDSTGSKDTRGHFFSRDNGKEDSSDDEALLKPVFLSACKRSDNACQEDIKDIEESEEEPVFSQELIPSGNCDDGDEEFTCTSSYKQLDSTGASSATFLSEATASTQKMEVLRQDVEAMEKEMEELRAYLAKTDEKREPTDHCASPDIQPSLTPPPPLTPKSIPPLRQLSTPLKEASRYLDQEGQSSGEESECEENTINEPVNRSKYPESSSCVRSKSTVRHSPTSPVDLANKQTFFSSYEADGTSIATVERQLVETPSPPASNGSVEMLNGGEKLIVLEDRDSDSRTGSLLLMKKRRIPSDFIPKKSPVVSLLFTKSQKSAEKNSASPRPNVPSRGSSPVVKRSSSFLYSRRHGLVISPRGHNLVANKRENSSSCESEKTRHLSFVATRLSKQQLADTRALAEAYGGKLASEFNSKTSHVIMATDENMQVTRHSYTMKYLLGLSLGKWIVSHHWITACKQEKTLVPEVNYEVKGDSGLGQNSIPLKARKARAKKDALLFHEFSILCFGGFGTAVTKDQLSQLLRFCGANVFSNLDSLKTTGMDHQKVVIIDKETHNNVDKIKALCRQLNTKAVSLEWVTDSIANYKVQDLRDYIVKL